MSKIISQTRFTNEAIDAHNRYRKQHGCPALELDEKLNQMAAEWAERLALKDKLEYRNTEYRGEPLGENILRANTIYFSGDAVTDEWYNENSSYKYDGKFSPNAGHFTQLIWKDTKKVGFGFAITDNGRFYAVAYYYPAGNFKGEYDANVPRPVTATSTLKITKTTTTYDGNNKPTTTTTTTTTSYMPITRNAPLYEPSPSNYSKWAPSSSSSSSPSPYSGNRSLLNDPSPPSSLNNSTPSGGAPGSTSQFIQEALNAHNTYRKKHGVDPLIHNPELSKIAQNYAEHIASLGTLKHSTNTYKGQKLGENLAFFYDSRMNHYPGDKCVEQWYSEIKDYRYRDYQPGTGHFTQVVWKGSREIGLGVARAKDGSFYGVANYLPAGNLLGTFSENVLKPLY